MASFREFVAARKKVEPTIQAPSVAGAASPRVSPEAAGRWYEVVHAFVWVLEAPSTTAEKLGYRWKGERVRAAPATCDAAWLELASGDGYVMLDARSIGLGALLAAADGPATAPCDAATAFGRKLVETYVPKRRAPTAAACDTSAAGVSRGLEAVDRSYRRVGLGDAHRRRTPASRRPPPVVDARGLSAAAFRDTYVATNSPVVLRRGLAASWPPLEKWDDGYLARAAGGRPIEARTRPAASGGARVYGAVGAVDLYKTTTTTLAALLADGAAASLYGARLDVAGDLPELAADATSPRFAAALGEPIDRSPTVYLGHGPSATPLHFDPAENLFCMVRGAKRVRLFPPSDADRLYPCGDRNAGSVHSLVDAFAPDYARFPAYPRDDEGLDLAVGEGDILYLPLGWWHAVRADTDGRHLSVNFWFAPPPSKRDDGAVLAGLLRGRAA